MNKQALHATISSPPGIKIRETTPFTITTNSIKYLGVTLTKQVEDLYDKNFKSLKKEVEEDTRKWKDFRCSWWLRVPVILPEDLGSVPSIRMANQNSLWAVSNREMLIAQNSSLEFKLHRLYFISLLMGGTTNQREALQYAKNFQPFALNHQKDIQVLMGSLVYLRQGIENSPYVHLLDANQWADICDIFTRDACALLGLSVESPLSVSFSAGCVALPALINIKAVIEQRQCTGVWNQKDELPIEVDLGKKCWYHSIFACPILRQQTTDNNPPMKLVCGHIISRDALNKMFNGSKSLRVDTSTFCAVATLFCVGLDIVHASTLQRLLELTVDLYSNQMSTDNVFSFVRCLHLMHSPQRTLRKSYSPYEELHGKDFCGHNSDLNP
ncbi:hypothetical protein U0070_017193 [Myodes glareolus]|uniref:RING-type E3 ubiquitin transferase n=1 Tax=Myodes glareolus TaxID=447135 RepID=A0AAW0HWX2_MYOGA